jgi:hypothetical protein
MADRQSPAEHAVDPVREDEHREQLDQLLGLVSLDNSIPHGTVAQITEGLRFSNMTQLHLLGSKLTTRLDDMNVIRLVAALSTANVGLEALTLSFHRITGALLLHFHVCLFVCSFVVVLLLF